MRAHILALRSKPCLRNARIVFIPESNLAGEANGVSEHIITMVTGIRIVSQKEDRYGCVTTQDTKRKFVFRFEDLLAHGAVSYHESLVSANPFIKNVTPVELAKRSRMEFERQLRSFRRIHMLSPSIQADPYVAFSGKAGPDNKNTSRMKDDMVMACLLGIYWAGQYLRGLLRWREAERALERDTGRVIAPIVRHVHDGGQDFADRQEQIERQYAIVPETVRKRPTLAQQLSSNAPLLAVK